MHYLPNEARREAEDTVQAAQAQAKYWCDQAKESERQLAEGDARRRDAEVESLRRGHETSWAAVKQATEYEERIKILEELVEEDRSRHEEALRNHEKLCQQAVDDAHRIAKETEERYVKLMASANARAKDAEERAEGARRRADDEVAAAKAREEARVQDIRRWADARVRECEDQKVFETQQMHEKVTQRQRQMEETLYLNGRQKSEALVECKRRTGAIEQEASEHKAMMEMEFARKEGRLDEWTSKQRRQNTTLETHHKAMLELEKGLHSRTMERTMQRINRQMEYGDAGSNGRDTPTRQVIRDVPPSPKSGGGLQALTAPGGALKLAGGSLAIGAA